MLSGYGVPILGLVRLDVEWLWSTHPRAGLDVEWLWSTHPRAGLDVEWLWSTHPRTSEARC